MADPDGPPPAAPPLGRRPLALLFVGSVVPPSFDADHPAARSPTIDIQRNLLAGLRDQGLTPERILSTLPVRRFPFDRRLWLWRPPLAYFPGVALHFLGLVNVEPLKTLTIGVHGLLHSVVWALGQWGRGRRPVFFLYNLGPTHHQVLFFWLAARLTGARFLALVTDVIPPTNRNPFAWLSFGTQTLGLKWLDGFVALNQNVIRDFGRQHPCVALQGLVPDDGLALRLAQLPVATPGPQAPLVMAYLGSLNRARGVDLLPELLAGLPADCRLIVAGRGPLEPLIRAAAARDPRLDFRGFLAQPDEIVAVIRDATCLLNPHRLDDPGARYVFPSKLTEYLASGRPVVSTTQGNVAAIYGEYVWLAAADDAAALRAAVLALRQTPPDAVRQRVTAARTYVLAHKLWRHHAPAIARFIRQVGASQADG